MSLTGKTTLAEFLKQFIDPLSKSKMKKRKKKDKDKKDNTIEKLIE